MSQRRCSFRPPRFVLCSVSTRNRFFEERSSSNNEIIAFSERRPIVLLSKRRSGRNVLACWQNQQDAVRAKKLRSTWCWERVGGKKKLAERLQFVPSFRGDAEQFYDETLAAKRHLISAFSTLIFGRIIFAFESTVGSPPLVATCGAYSEGFDESADCNLSLMCSWRSFYTHFNDRFIKIRGISFRQEERAR
jgi:hypothetical protein